MRHWNSEWIFLHKIYRKCWLIFSLVLLSKANLIHHNKAKVLCFQLKAENNTLVKPSILKPINTFKHTEYLYIIYMKYFSIGQPIIKKDWKEIIMKFILNEFNLIWLRKRARGKFDACLTGEFRALWLVFEVQFNKYVFQLDLPCSIETRPHISMKGEYNFISVLMYHWRSSPAAYHRKIQNNLRLNKRKVYFPIINKTIWSEIA